jgi:hypothetical protein
MLNLVCLCISLSLSLSLFLFHGRTQIAFETKFPGEYYNLKDSLIEDYCLIVARRLEYPDNLESYAGRSLSFW